jgi:hypothetical protein
MAAGEKDRKEFHRNYAYPPYSFKGVPLKEAVAPPVPSIIESPEKKREIPIEALLEESPSYVSLSSDSSQETIGVGHTRAFIQLREIMEMSAEGKISGEESSGFLEELNLYLTEKMENFGAIENLAPGDEPWRNQILQGLQCLQRSVSDLQDFLENPKDDSPQDMVNKVTQEAQEADNLIFEALSAMTGTSEQPASNNDRP